MSFDVDPLTLLARAILALGAGLIIPLGMIATTPAGADPGARFHRFVRRLLSPAAVPLLVSLVSATGDLAPVLALPWVAASALVLAVGARRLLARARTPRRFDLAELAIDAGFAYLPVGAVWAWVYRADVDLLGFAGVQALLTANHFHFAGFGMCVLVGLVGRRLGARAGLAYRAAAVLAVLAVALVAAGITVSRSLEVFAAWALVLGVILTAVSLVRASRTTRGVPRVLLIVSAIAGVIAAGFAAHFATGGFARLDAVKLRQMLFFHALVNALGFVGAGLAAFALDGATRAEGPPGGDQGEKTLSSSPDTTTT